MDTRFDFSAALRLLKDGKRVAREGWNGKGMWLRLVPAKGYVVSQMGQPMPKPGTMSLYDDDVRELLPWIGMRTADDKFVPWLCSQTDMLAEDWVLIP